MSPNGVQGRAPAWNAFWRIFKATECSFFRRYADVLSSSNSVSCHICGKSRCLGSVAPCYNIEPPLNATVYTAAKHCKMSMFTNWIGAIWKVPSVTSSTLCSKDVQFRRTSIFSILCTRRQAQSADKSVVFGPRVLLEEAVNYFFHRKVWNELILRKVCPRHGIKMTDSLTKHVINNYTTWVMHAIQ